MNIVLVPAREDFKVALHFYGGTVGPSSVVSLFVKLRIGIMFNYLPLQMGEFSLYY